MGLKEDFDQAAEKVKNLNSKPTDEELLEIYALYKQATVGDNTTPSPGMFDFKGKAKWAAWDKKKGMTKEAAMDAYIVKVTVLVDAYGLK